MAPHYIFIVTLVALHSLYGGISAGNDNTAGQTSNTDVKMALIEKDMEHIKSVLNAVLKQVQTTAAKQQAMESSLATEIQNVKLRDEKLIQGLNVHVRAMLDKDSILSTKLQVLETQQQQQANALKAVESTQANQIQELKSSLKSIDKKYQAMKSTQDTQIQKLNSRLKDTVMKQQAIESTQAAQIQELKSRDEKQAAQIQELKNTDEKLILNRTAHECGCKEELNRLNFTGVALYNDLLTRQSSLESKISRQFSHLNQTVKECSCQQELDVLNFALTNLYYIAMNRSTDCADLYQRGFRLSGVYTVSSADQQGEFDVYCDMETDGGGWTVFQRRQDGSVDFFRNWNDYKNGFGNVAGEFWLGNDRLHQLTSVKNYVLRVDLENWSNVKIYATYTQFAIADENDKYRITLGRYTGNAGDSLGTHRGQQFSTKDQDNDANTSADCANKYIGAWWYNHCHHANLNGFYYKQETTSTAGVVWLSHPKLKKTLKMTEMKIRPAEF